MTEERKRAEDVYALVKDLEQEHQQLMKDVPEIKDTVDVMADVVIGPKIPDPNRPNEWRVNGKGRYERDSKQGLAHIARKLSWQNQLWKFIGQLAAILTGVALIVGTFGGG